MMYLNKYVEPIKKKHYWLRRYCRTVYFTKYTSFSQHEMVLAVKERIPDTKDYKPERELIWNTSQSADARCLHKSIANLLNVQVIFIHLYLF